MKAFARAEDSGRSPALRWLLGMLLLVVWSMAIAAVSLYYASITYGPELFDSYFKNGMLLLLNWLPVLLLALLFFGVTNRVWPGVLISGFIALLGSFANYFMLMTRTEALMAGDLIYIREAAGIGSRYSIKPTPLMWVFIALLLVASALAFLFLRARFTKWLPRVIFLVVVLGGCAAAWFYLYSSDKLYTKMSNIEVEFADGYVLNKWNSTDQYVSRGFLYPFVHSMTDLGSKKPEGYNKSEASAALAEYPSGGIPDYNKIDVIAVMLEAYTDFTPYSQLRIGYMWNDPYAYFHQLEAEGIYGDLVTNIFAGGTIDTERCFLTGSTELYDYRGPAESYARWFGEQGYDTTFCHAGYSWFYNRKNVAEFLGFQESYFSDGYFEDCCTTIIPSDKDFFPALLEMYREHKEADGKPYFNFSVTYQNHGPYPSDYFRNPTVVYMDGSEMTVENYRIFSNYLDGIQRTDAALREFIEELRTQPDPVIVVLFGDHKPWLGDNSVVYDEVGIDVKWKTADSFNNIYRTQYVIWANDAAREAIGLDYSGWGGEFSPCFLMMKLFDVCGWTGDGNMNAMRELFTQMDVVHEKGCRKGGKFISSLSEEAQTLLDQYRCIQYYRMHDALR